MAKNLITRSLWNVALIAVLCACDSSKSTARVAQTKSRLKNAYYSLKVLEKEHGTPIETQLIRAKGKTLHDQFCFLLVSAGQQDGIAPETISRNLCYDGYGNPFNVEFRTNIGSKSASGIVLRAESELLIWSSGENGINEYGSGDDVAIAP